MLSKTAKYAIRVTIYIATESDQENKVGVAEIAEALKAPRHFLAKILQQLSKDGLIDSVRGPGGGFYITEENMEKSVMDVIESVETKTRFRGCVLGLPTCSDENPCPLHRSLVTYRDGLFYQFSHHTIRELAQATKFHGYKI